MGTRNLTMVVNKEKIVVAQYGQWDGYPEGNGLTVVRFLNSEFHKRDFLKKISRVVEATDEEIENNWIEAGAKKGEDFISMDISKKYKELFPELSRDTGAEILSVIQNSEKDVLKLKSTLDFAYDGLFCEWAYLVDLDRDVLEVYEGFGKEPLTKKDRFYVKPEEQGDYAPIRKVAEFSFASKIIEKEFLAELKGDNKDE